MVYNRYHVTLATLVTTIVCNYLSGIYGLIHPPYPHINVEKRYFCVARGGMGEKKWGNGGKITGDRSRDVSQNIFAHDLRCK